MFGRATIAMGIGPHSSYVISYTSMNHGLQSPGDMLRNPSNTYEKLANQTTLAD